MIVPSVQTFIPPLTITLRNTQYAVHTVYRCNWDMPVNERERRRGRWGVEEGWWGAAAIKTNVRDDNNQRHDLQVTLTIIKHYVLVIISSVIIFLRFPYLIAVEPFLSSRIFFWNIIIHISEEQILFHYLISIICCFILLIL